MSENRRIDEEIGENLWSGEEISEILRSGETMSENRSSDDDWGVEEEPRCIASESDPAHPHMVSRVAGDETKQDCSSCGKKSICSDPRYMKKFHYYCTICQVEFHRGCHDYPSKMIHPYHPQHPLTFTFRHKYSRMIVDTNYGELRNIYFKDMSIELQKRSVPILRSSIIFDKCTWCSNDLGEWFYRCQICNFSLDLLCARNFPPVTIQNPKSHHHSLSLFPRPLLFPCDACGLIDVLEPGYACYQCNYVVHQRCIDLPRVIKITRHPHRISHTPYLPTKVSTCRVCYKNVDIKYSQYSCSHEDCSYVVHSKCATHKEVWDGKELEWVPEEPDQTEDIAPYKKVGAGLIEHICHDHHYLKLETYNGIRDSRKKCQACMRSIASHDFYNCIECEFFLHEVCANLPRKLDHALHKHSLFMDLYSLCCRDEDLVCYVCTRKSNCWKYKCKKEGCKLLDVQFMVDVNCILVPDYFTHESHPEHLVFAATTTVLYSNYGKYFCQGCKKEIYAYRLHCTKCEFVICYKCSTIPNEVYYKFDENLLSLCYGEIGMDDMYWCEVCEKRLDPTEWFYTNKEGCTTIHLKCLFGDSAYMKPGHTFDFGTKKVEVVSSSSSRPTCIKCQQPCPHPVYFKVYGTVVVFCSFSCINNVIHMFY